MRTTQKILAIGVVGLLLFVGCSKAQSDGTTGSDQPGSRADTKELSSEGQTDAIQAPGAPEDAALSAPTRDESLAQIPPLPPGGDLRAGERVIRNASLSVRISEGEFQDKFQQANALAARFGGFVAATSTEETEGRIASGNVTLRVPSDKFEDAIEALKELGEVSAEEKTGHDVSAEFVDLEARLRHAKTQEAFYLRLIDRATEISDMIQIQQQLSQIQLQIESIQGRLKFLEDQTSFSTINVRIFEPDAGPPPARGALLDALVRAWEGFQNVVAGVIVGLGWVAPFALVALVGYAVWRFFRRDKTTAVPESSGG
ncbi:MAG: DUF4349 domain-containing protein [Actinobacteria bacterium]|nr:DUF4349 domain-containing protein [Actinomycetota bacterium]